MAFYFISKLCVECVWDIVYCVDNSGTIRGAEQNDNNFNFIKVILRYITKQVKVSNSGNHVALVDFG